MIRVGTDIVMVERIGRAAENPRFMERVFTTAERDYFAAHGNSKRTLAGLFCAKEAVVKALGCGFSDGVAPADVEILHDGQGAPYVVLHGAAAIKAGGRQISVSVTHDGDYAAAICAIGD